MRTFTCPDCGREHDEMSMAIAYRRPAYDVAVPSAERDARVFWNEDCCLIDDKEFVIRGVLPLPIKGTSRSFDWGVWAIVAVEHFKRYLELWDGNGADAEPPFDGWLPGRIGPYEGSDGLAVKGRLQTGN